MISGHFNIEDLASITAIDDNPNVKDINLQNKSGQNSTARFKIKKENDANNADGQNKSLA